MRGFLRQRLGIGVSVRVQEIEDGLPLELSHLELWEIGERLLSARLRGAEAADALAAERARGSVSPGLIGEERLNQIADLVELVMTEARGVLDLDAEQQTLDVRVTLDDGRLIGGTISGLRGDVLQHVRFSRIGPRQRLGAWARLLVLTAAFPERKFSAVSVGRARKGISRRLSVSVARAASPSGLGSVEEREGWARKELGKLVDLFDRGLREPLPLYCQTSAELASAHASSARRRAEEAWTSDFEKPRENTEEEHLRVLRSERSFAELVSEAPREDEDWFGERFDSRLECYAHRLWDGLLAVETVSER